MASTYLSRSVTTTGNQRTWTFSAWVKRSKLGTTQFLISAKNVGETTLHFRSQDDLQLELYDGNNYYIRTNRLFRDTNAWYHIVAIWDSIRPTASDRMRLYVNGVQETSFSVAVYPPQNYDSYMNQSGETNYIGNYGGSSSPFDGSMSHIHLIDGNDYNASYFGEYDANGVWKIITEPSVTYGTNGFFILKDGNSVTDQSGNGNNFTVASGTLTNTEDCPSNVFATLNRLDVSAGTPAGLINGNNTYNKTATGNGTNGARLATIAPSSGKWYWEFKPADSVSVILGFARTNHLNATAGLNGWIGEDVGTFGIRPNGNKIIAGSESSASYSFTTNDILGFAMDLDNNKFYVHKNGTYYNSGDPTSGSTGTGSIGNITAGNNYAPLVQNNSYNETNVVHCNFGNGYFETTAVSSAGTNASGIGIFEYDVPTGYTALSTKGLNE